MLRLNIQNARRVAPGVAKPQLNCLTGFRKPLVKFAPPKHRAEGCTARAAAESDAAVASTAPLPKIKIDNTSDNFATILKIDYGDRLGELLDTIQALKNLGLNIRRAKLSEDTRNKFYITDAATAEKIVKSAKLEEIRQVILQNLINYHPEVAPTVNTSTFSGDSERDSLHPLGANQQKVNSTKLTLTPCDESPFTKLKVTTQDRPGLLVDIVRTLKDCNINVLSAEIDTIGSEAQDEFLLCYRGEPLNSSMQTLVKNALQYYLALAEVENVESY